MKITANFDKRILKVSNVFGNIKSDINKSLVQSTKVIKDNIKAELRSPNKTGSLKKKRIRFSSRRSAFGESLARDTGDSERLISSSNIGNLKVEVGFLDNPSGFNYIQFQEIERNRPTMEKAVENSLNEINQIFDRNLKPKL